MQPGCCSSSEEVNLLQDHQTRCLRCPAPGRSAALCVGSMTLAHAGPSICTEHLGHDLEIAIEEGDGPQLAGSALGSAPPCR
jgi:hypothetical protein